jgi:hypothetical protein
MVTIAALPKGSQPYAPEVEEYARGLIEAANAIRLPELFAAPHPDALYQLHDRNGVSVVAVRTPGLSEAQLIKLLRYRMAQYLVVHFVNHAQVYAARIEHEPVDLVAPGDVHVIAGNSATGEILCYAVLRDSPQARPGCTMREQDRPLFPAEELYGWGVFNRLRIFPDLPAGKVREIGRFMKNQQLAALDELGARGPIEVGVAMFHILVGPLRMEVDAFIGDIEEGVAGQNLAFFHTPMVVVHSTPPYESEDSYLFLRHQYRTIYPFAALVSDLTDPMRTRLPQIEQALALPGKQGVLALVGLKRDLHASRSSLAPPDYLDPLIDSALPQQGIPMHQRRAMLDVGERVRQFPLFSGLSVAEATVLGSFMECIEVPAGEVIVRRWECGDSLYLVEAGEAIVQIARPNGPPVQLGAIQAGDYFGEIALLTGGERTADVVACTPMTLLKLGRDAYVRYLRHVAEVDQNLAHTATRRATAVIRSVSAT